MMVQAFNPEPSAVRVARQLSYRIPRPTTSFAGPSPSGSTKVGLRIPRLGRAGGGGIPDSPDMPFTGPIFSKGAGRTDDVPMHVPNGSYVIPADVVSHMGEGNSMNGLTLLKMMFSPTPWNGGKGGPWGANAFPQGQGRGVKIPRPPRPIPGYNPTYRPAGQPPSEKAGGLVKPNQPSNAQPINASGGEFVIPPAEVKRRGGGDINKGHKILDAWVLDQRKQHIDTLKKLPGPAQ